jgi:alanine racemase
MEPKLGTKIRAWSSTTTVIGPELHHRAIRAGAPVYGIEASKRVVPLR